MYVPRSVLFFLFLIVYLANATLLTARDRCHFLIIGIQSGSLIMLEKFVYIGKMISLEWDLHRASEPPPFRNYWIRHCIYYDTAVQCEYQFNNMT